MLLRDAGGEIELLQACNLEILALIWRYRWRDLEIELLEASNLEIPVLIWRYWWRYLGR
jgi:hypothetical protein